MSENMQPMQNRVIELPNVEQLKKEVFIFREGKFRKKYATNLEKYYGKGSIDKDQFRAGERLYSDAFNGLVLSNLKAIDYTRVKPRDKTAKPSEMTANQAYSHKAWSDAFFSERLGAVQRDILWWVVICDNEISKFSDNRAYAIGLLRETLNELVRYYKS